jgi:hypothetical protein
LRAASAHTMKKRSYMDEAALFAEQLSTLHAKLLAIDCLANGLLEQLDKVAKLAVLEAACISGQRLSDDFRHNDPPLARALLDELQPMISRIQAIRAKGNG